MKPVTAPVAGLIVAIAVAGTVGVPPVIVTVGAVEYPPPAFATAIACNVIPPEVKAAVTGPAQPAELPANKPGLFVSVRDQTCKVAGGITGAKFASAKAKFVNDFTPKGCATALVKPKKMCGKPAPVPLAPPMIPNGVGALGATAGKIAVFKLPNVGVNNAKFAAV